MLFINSEILVIIGNYSLNYQEIKKMLFVQTHFSLCFIQKNEKQKNNLKKKERKKIVRKSEKR